ncbi:MAG: cytochrome c oxidase subunit 3 [Bacteroidia bacterium]|jgi:cytochrome c oxidase subunit 3|nr:cytochrome c oxidase subunit 3 [Bacteroidota bacterium]MBP6512684.1 cytochrome c oxidase subunit 3 [Bacteroidia bacterium]MBP7244094.1 cytochrome c oxidase subunit 3 [Bacteroidia bacterium]
MEMAIENQPQEKPKIATEKVLLAIGIGSIVMLFAGLTSGYIVRQAEGNWKFFEVPSVFYISTIIILISSFTMQMAIRAVKKDDLAQVKTFLLITLGLGLAFVFSQFLGWNELVKNDVYFADKLTPSGSFFYVITGLHLAHLAFGLLGLIITGSKSIRERYNSQNYLGISLCAIYWHFLGGLWIYLFVFLAIYR